MKLSAQEEYGLRCLLRLGAQGDGGSLTIPEISRTEGISPEYVAKLMRILRQGGLVTSARGATGGVTSRDAGRAVCPLDPCRRYRLHGPRELSWPLH